MSSSLLICAETLAERRPPCHPLAGGTCFVTLLHSPRLCSGSILCTYAASLLSPASRQSQCLPVHVFVDANGIVREPRIPKISIFFDAYGTRWAS